MTSELTGQHVRLAPLTNEHVDGLLAAATESRDTYVFTHVPADRADMMSYVDTAIAARDAGEALPYAIFRHSTGRIVGCTRLFDFASWSGGPFPDVAEIGHTWYAASAQRTACNTEAKLLLLTMTFDEWRARRITLKTDARNARSRAAIMRIGGQFEGIRRAHQLASDGTVRDTAYYSIIAAEWPDVRRDLLRRLESPSDRRSVIFGHS